MIGAARHIGPHLRSTALRAPWAATESLDCFHNQAPQLGRVQVL